MKKGKILLFTFIFECIIFTFCLFLKLEQFNVFELWFSLALFLIGIYSLIYSHMYTLDSCLYLGVLLICFAFATAYRYLTIMSFGDFYPIYFACFAFAHLSVFVMFRQNIHFKIFAILMIEVILLMSYKANLLSFLLLALINGMFLLFVVLKIILRAWKNLRRVSKWKIFQLQKMAIIKMRY